VNVGLKVHEDEEDQILRVGRLGPSSTLSSLTSRHGRQKSYEFLSLFILVSFAEIHYGFLFYSNKNIIYGS
jgi:hypothetical protein